MALNLAIIDYQVGNLGSILNAFTHLQNMIKIKLNLNIESNPQNLKNYDKILLPGVGAFGDAFRHLQKNGMDSAIIEFAKSGKIILGICLGMQLLFEKSYEFGEHKGLGLIEGEVTSFDKAKLQNLKIPHIGWNSINIKLDSGLLKGIKQESYLYFVHSFHANCEDRFILADANYGYNFPAIINKNNIYGIQPHPEKSQSTGLNILQNFILM